MKYIALILMVSVIISACGSHTQSTQKANTKHTANTHIELLNVSYDVSRDFYKQYNPLFVEYYQNVDPDTKITIKQSHGGSSKQALSVANGLAADVVTMNQNADIDILVDKNLVDSQWKNNFSNQAVPFTSATVFLVRKNNPKNIQDWQDLSRPDIQIVMPNPKTSGNGRYAFLGAYGYGLHTFDNNTAKTDDFMQSVLANVAVFDAGARAATTTFVQRGIGDVLITAENEANIIANELQKDAFLVVYPSYTVAAENPVAVVQAVTDKKGTTDIAKAYLEYLWSKPAQALAAQLYLRPSDPAVLNDYAHIFPNIQTFLVHDVFGDWDTMMQDYFADGAKFDILIQNKSHPKTP